MSLLIKEMEHGALQGIIAGFMADTTVVVHRFLFDWLPEIGRDDWWEQHVLRFLSDSQVRMVKEKNITTLAGLDLAALVKVFSRNLSTLRYRASLPQEIGHHLIELSHIRNRWAHVGLEGYPDADVYRDLDTLYRLLEELDADDVYKDSVRDARDRIFKAAPKPEEPKTVKPLENGVFSNGDMVCLISDRAKQGPILSVQEGEEKRYQVFMDGAKKSFYESQLQPVDESSGLGELITLDEFNAQMTALQIQHPSLSTLYSLNSARVDFIPYQFRPVLKFIRADRPRLLIADGVGVGKTIEAGLILRELQARRDVRSVLIICPRPLVTERKWESEMRRFDEKFTHLDGQALRYCIAETDLEGEWPTQHSKTIIPYSLFDESLLHGSSGGRGKKKKLGLLDLDPPPKFDLVIVDEAHHIRNTDTFSHQAVKYFVDNAEAAVFLTATPVQMGSHDLFVLLNLLRPDLVIDEESFRHMAAPNPYINRAIDSVRGGQSDWQAEAAESLRQSMGTEWGGRFLAPDPECKKLLDSLENSNMTQVERVKSIGLLESFHTFSSVINRTRRRDIGDFTVRDPRTVEVEFTDAQRNLHDAVLDTQAAIFSELHPTQNINFLMTTIRRQAASCLYGLAPLIRDILSRRIDELIEEEGEGVYGSGMGESPVDEILGRIVEVESLAEKLDPKDPKSEALIKIIADKQEMENNKAILFSSFRHTLSYLFAKLSAGSVRVGMVHGGTPDGERVEYRRRFKLDKTEPEAIDVLLFSEIGCEGLDYQFCDCMINYDLPWNPMRVEQRIGRIDRRGQKSDKVMIYNLITPGTVDADIYSRCLMRIGVFNAAVGAGEEILGTIAKEIASVAEDMALSEGERQEKLQQISDNQIRNIQEQEVLEEKQAELFGIRLPTKQMEEDIEDASSCWLTPRSIENLVAAYLSELVGGGQKYILGEKSGKSLRVAQDGRNKLLKEFQKLPRQASLINKQWEDYLKGGSPHLKITFTAKGAMADHAAAFINPTHPLLRQASKLIGPKDTSPLVSIVSLDDEIEPGSYSFAIYEWSFSGVKEDLMLRPVSTSSQVATKLPQLLEFATPNSGDHGIADLSAELEGLDGQHYALWSEAKKNHIAENEKIAAYKKESLETSHRSRLAILEEKLDVATDEKIQRMRQSQIKTAQADYDFRLSELLASEKRAELNAQPISYGVVTIVRPSANDEGDGAQ